MKILFVNDYGSEIAGAEKYVFSTMTALKDLGHQVSLFASDLIAGEGDIYSNYTFKAIDSRSRLRIIPYIFNWNSLRKLKTIIALIRPDIIHLNYIFYHTSPSILSVLGNIPTVMTVHAHEIIAPVGLELTPECNHDFFGYCLSCARWRYFPEKIKRIIFKSLNHKINLYISPSKYYRNILSAQVGPVINMPNGINLGASIPMTQFNRILYIGRLAPEKGILTLLQAFNMFSKNSPESRLTVIGYGPLDKHVKEFIRNYGLEHAVSYLGRIPNQDINEHIHKSSVIIVPSNYPDNFPYVVLEAFAAGRPVIGSDIGGISEMIDEGVNGMKVNPGDIRELAQKIYLMLRNKRILAGMGNEAHKSAQKYDIRLYARKLESIYERLL